MLVTSSLVLEDFLRRKENGEWVLAPGEWPNAYQVLAIPPEVADENMGHILRRRRHIMKYGLHKAFLIRY